MHTLGPRSLSGFPASLLGAAIITALASGSTLVLNRELYHMLTERRREGEGKREEDDEEEEEEEEKKRRTNSKFSSLYS